MRERSCKGLCRGPTLSESLALQPTRLHQQRSSRRPGSRCSRKMPPAQHKCITSSSIHTMRAEEQNTPVNCKWQLSSQEKAGTIKKKKKKANSGKLQEKKKICHSSPLTHAAKGNDGQQGRCTMLLKHVSLPFFKWVFVELSVVLNHPRLLPLLQSSLIHAS